MKSQKHVREVDKTSSQ